MKNLRITVNGNSYDVVVEDIGGSAPASAPAAAPVQTAPKAAPAAKPVGNMSGTKVNSPLPGKVSDVKVKEGDTVKKGDVLLSIEAMKMENEINSPADGKIGNIVVEKGTSVETGDLLLLIV